MNHPASDSTPLPKPRHWRRRLLRTVIVLASLVVLFYAEENWRSARAWDRVQARLQARGEPLTMEQYLKPVPEEENFFAAPVVLKQFDKSEPRWLPFKEDRTLSEALGAAWENEKKCDLSAALKWLRENATWPLPAETGKVGADILAVLAPADAGLAELREAVRRPRAQMLAGQALPGDSMPGFKFMLGTARLYELRRLALLHDGRTAEACEESLQSIRFARQVSARPVNLMYYLVACATAGNACVTLRDTNRGIPWDEAQLRALETELATLHVADHCADMLRGERVFNLAMLNAMSPNSMTVAGRGTIAAPIGTRLFPAGWKQMWMASMCDAIQQRIESIEQHGLRDTGGRTFETGWFPPQPFSARVSAARNDPMAEHASILKNGLIQDGHLHIARVALAAARWRLAKGHPPASLAELAAWFPAGIPEDPLTGQPLRYKAAADGSFTVSTPGANLSDPDDDNSWKVPPPAPLAPVSLKAPPVR